MESVIEQHELDFSNPEDWDVFLESAEDIYLEAMVFEARAKAENYQSLSDEEVSGEEIFTTMFQKLEQLEHLTLSISYAVKAGERIQVGDEEIDQMQDLYNEIVLLSNHVQDCYEALQLEVPTPTPIPPYVPPAPKSEPDSTSEKVMVKEPSPLPEAEVTPVQTVAVKPVETKEMPEIPESVTKESSLWEAELPVVGVTGIKTARTLRELLLKARDQDPVFIRDTKKQLAADKMVRLLGFIASEGLSPEQLVVIKELAQIIGITKSNNELEVKETEVSEVAEAEDSEEVGKLIAGFDNHSYSRKDVKIATDTEVVSPIKIKVTQQAQAKFEHKTKVTPAIKTTVEQQRPVVTQAVLAEKIAPAVQAKIEQKDPINKIFPNFAPRIRPTNEIHKKTLLTDLFVVRPEYINFIKTYYKSMADFERNLDSGVTQIENSTVDVFEKWLGEEFASPFAFMQSKSVGEVLKLAGSDDVRLVLAKKNIKYETFVTWVDLITEMQNLLGDDDNRRLFGDLYTSWVIESEMAFVASLRSTHNSQVSR